MIPLSQPPWALVRTVRVKSPSLKAEGNTLNFQDMLETVFRCGTGMALNALQLKVEEEQAFWEGYCLDLSRAGYKSTTACQRERSEAEGVGLTDGKVNVWDLGDLQYPTCPPKQVINSFGFGEESSGANHVDIHHDIMCCILELADVGDKWRWHTPGN